MADARTDLQLYVAGGNLRQAESPEAHIAIQKERLALLSSRLRQWRENMGRTIVTPEDAPADFRAALEDADERAYQRSLHEQGKDIPRLEPKNPTAAKALNYVYRAHDTVVGLPTPAGVGALILIIGMLFLVLIPATAKGETRMLLLWDVLLGRKQMPGSAHAEVGDVPQDIRPGSGSQPATTIPGIGGTAAPTTAAPPVVSNDFTILGLGEVI